MLKVNNNLHKSLLQLDKKPIICHIIHSIPLDFEILILLGHRANQVKSAIEFFFPKRKIKFQVVSDYESEKSGTALSLLECEKLINNEFWYFPCDGIFSGEIFNNINYLEDTVYVKKLSSNFSTNYTWFETCNNRVTKIIFKDFAQSEYISAFTGVMFIKNYVNFFYSLRTNYNLSNDLEFVNSIPIGAKTMSLESWRDLGNPTDYNEEVGVYEKFDFSKPEEVTYDFENSIIKWNKNIETVKDKIIKPNNNPTVYPKILQTSEEFIKYRKVIGQTFYEHVTPEKFEQLLQWLDQYLWRRSNIDITNDCKLFYEDKTNMRYKSAKELIDFSYNDFTINNVPIKKNLESYIFNINWEYISKNTVTTEIHGDLQFDNIIFNNDTSQFKLIDWRTSFGNQKVVGDIYYDLAKILGGIYLNYYKIKNNIFEFSIHDKNINLVWPSCDSPVELYEILKDFSASSNLDFHKVELLVPIIYINMMPLHKPPFSSFLYFFSIYKFDSLGV